MKSGHILKSYTVALNMVKKFPKVNFSSGWSKLIFVISNFKQIKQNHCQLISLHVANIGTRVLISTCGNVGTKHTYR